MPSLIALAPNSWDGPWMNRQQLLSRMAARGWRVAYGTGPLFFWDRRSDHWRSAPLSPSTELRDGVLVVRAGRLLPRWPRWRKLDNLALRHYARCLEQLCDRQCDILHIFHPSFLPFVDLVRARAVVYHAYDAFDGLEVDEKALLQRADRVLASSASIAAHLKTRLSRSVAVLPNGVDFAAFSMPTAVPEELAAIPKPRIGYLGRINPKVDLALVLAVARRRPDWHWVFVGAVQEEAFANAGLAELLAQIRAAPNVHFLGHRHHSQLPAFAQAMDVNALCYTTTGSGWWTSIYPLKMHEYLAAGRPVVSVPLDSAMPFADVIDVCTNADSWIDGIEHALRDGGVGTTAQRRAVARGNDWDKRVAVLDGWFRELVTQAVPAQYIVDNYSLTAEDQLTTCSTSRSR